jgi:hypothetical protein
MMRFIDFYIETADEDLQAAQAPEEGDDSEEE